MSSKSDQRRYDALQKYGCACCRIIGFHNPGDIHHVVTNGYRRLSGGNKSTICLCPYHHRGITDGSAFVTRLGPSLAHGSKAFEAHWGSQESLLARVNEEIGVAA
jgi:hypothetical protein